MFNHAGVLFYFSRGVGVLFKFFFFMVPSVSVLTEFHFLIKSNICQKVIQTSCESRTVSWKLTTKTDCDVQLRTQMLSIQCRLYILYPNPHSWINGGGKLPVPATVQVTKLNEKAA